MLKPEGPKIDTNGETGKSRLRRGGKIGKNGKAVEPTGPKMHANGKMVKLESDRMVKW